MRIPRDEYRKKVLPDLIKAHGSDPDRLVAVLMQAVRDGFATDVIPAANRLTVVDKNVERALTVLAVVQRDAGELDLAEGTLKELQQKLPKSLAAPVGLAMLAERRGDAATCERLLWQVLEQEPNHPDAVHGWLQMRHRTVGDDGYGAALEQLVALPGAWRGRLWQARYLVEKGDDAAAAAIYRDVLSQEAIEGDALLMASADLVQRQKHDLVAELIAPRFRSGRHHPHVGMALLHHHHQRRDFKAGEALLHRLFVDYGHVIGGELAPWTAEFDRMRLETLPKVAPPPPDAQIGLYRFDRPLWFAGYDDPQWLVPPKPAAHKHVMFFSLALDGSPQIPAGREEEIGRLTRSVPLWLAEQAWLSSPHRGTAVIPLAAHGGWAVMGRAWPEQQLVQQVPEAERKDTLLVTGQLHIDGEKRRIDLWVYDCATDQRVGHAAAEAAADKFGEALLQLMAELWPLLGGPQGHKPQVGDATFWHRYADGLAQHAALVVTQAGGMARERLFGERYITQWLQNAALSETRWQPGFWLLGSALGVLHQLGSKVPLEHARLVAEVFRQSPPNSAFARLGARLLRVCGLEALWQGRRDEVLAACGEDPNARAWIERCEKA
ncbi:MAG: hypothetical protein H6835_19090 [Planctomycetes bacterium]|nr:hypothetical protein [Planctomycetota bacterium]